MTDEWMKENNAKLRELDEWRTGKRRVFWRVRWEDPLIGSCYLERPSKREAVDLLGDGALYRVIVRPKVKR